MNNHRPLTLLFLTFAVQMVGLGGGILASALLTSPTMSSLLPGSWSAYLTLAVHAVVAFSIASWLDFPRAWQLCNLVIAPGALICIQFDIAPELALIPLVTLLLIYVPTFWTRVPFYPTSRRTYDEILSLIPPTRGLRMIDLGSGFGSLVLYLARCRPDLALEGAEISPLPYFLSALRAASAPHPKPKFALKSFWKLSLAPYDVVYAFLAPGPMPALWEKARREMRSGTLLIVNSFPVDATPERVVTVRDGRTFTLFVYRIP